MLQIPLCSVVVIAEGDVDLRGTMGVADDVPVGFAAIGWHSMSTPTRRTPSSVNWRNSPTNIA
ncbi:hypothetical protein [Mesorhizobium loti]|uniref:hypothetical protein n=1 Tax=Rhizobium loti TaxID=381 RepID=UPI0003FF49D0|nr:hypothetical protein [Mesorhizobium loti]